MRHSLRSSHLPRRDYKLLKERRTFSKRLPSALSRDLYRDGLNFVPRNLMKCETMQRLQVAVCNAKIINIRGVFSRVLNLAQPGLSVGLN